MWFSSEPWNTRPAPHPLHGAQEFSLPVQMCFVDLEKSSNIPCGAMCGNSRSTGVEFWSLVLIWTRWTPAGLPSVTSQAPLCRRRFCFWDQTNLSRLLADEFLQAPFCQDLQHALRWLAAKCEVPGMRFSFSKATAMVLNWKKVHCLFQVEEQFLPQVEEYEYLGIKRKWRWRSIDRLVQLLLYCGRYIGLLW